MADPQPSTFNLDGLTPGNATNGAAATDQAAGALPVGSVGDQLRTAREAHGLTIEQLSERTRVSQRHLLAIEAGRFDLLPGRTYITGFTRAYAREVGLDDVALSTAVRAEIAEQGSYDTLPRETYTPADPARLPGRALALTAVGVVLLASAAYALWRSSAVPDGTAMAETELTRPADTAAAAPAPAGIAAKAAAPAPAVPADAEVVLIANSEVWVGFDDAGGKTVAYRTLKANDRFVIPADYKGRLALRTVRPQAVTLTVAGRQVPPLGEADRLVKGISLAPADLAARAAGTAAPSARAPTASGGATTTTAATPATAAPAPVIPLPPTRPGTP